MKRPMGGGEKLFTYTDLISLLGARSYGVRQEIHSVCIDSREWKPGSLFIPLEGERTDGHLYISDILKKGGITLCEESYWEKTGGSLKTVLETTEERAAGSILVVNSSLASLQLLAKRHLEQFTGLIKVGITGSNGKTTTKEIVAAIFSEMGSTYKNPGNFNSDIGLPLSVLEITDDYKYAVLEMGMNRRGEILELAEVLKPTAALITNIGSAHIGLLGSRRGIANEKAKIFSCFSGGETAFLNESDSYLADLQAAVGGRCILFGRNSTYGVAEISSLGLSGWEFRYEDQLIHFPLYGEYNLLNALGAVSLAREFGATPEQIAAGLGNVHSLFGRSRILQGEITLIEDCYNANFESMAESIHFFTGAPVDGERIAVLGDMRELGSYSDDLHRRIGEECSGFPGTVLFYGVDMKHAYEVVKESSTKCSWYTDIEKLGRDLRAQVKSGDAVLLKGSRSLELERLEGCLGDYLADTEGLGC